MFFEKKIDKKKVERPEKGCRIYQFYATIYV